MLSSDAAWAEAAKDWRARGSRNIGLQAERIGVGHAGLGVFGSERRRRRGLVEPDEGVELLRQRGIGVVAHQLGIGPVDNPYEPLQPGLQKASAECLVPAEV